ncbi:AIM24 family protein [Pleurocapsa sp. CCALA 161]|uniref:AIM24 family protein n=1 Tax=Pleurocapsa sp. CCALA 161 TaxID=2107688 RepID=UPI0018EA76A4|nr:AIM24 family protein [Pleurocapsa sp. CCALA 161]
MFKLRLSGKGRVFFGAYGGITKEDTLKYSVENIGGLSFKSLKTGIFGGEGFVCRFSGEGRLWIQSHNLSPLINFLNPFRPTKSD